MDDTDVEFDEPPIIPEETEEDIKREREIMLELGYKFENGHYVEIKNQSPVR